MKLIGLSKRSFKRYWRKEAAACADQQERISRNVGEVEFLRQQGAARRAHEEHIKKQDEQIARDRAEIDAVVTRMNDRADKLEKELIEAIGLDDDSLKSDG
jgi:hypothetical protein